MVDLNFNSFVLVGIDRSVCILNTWDIKEERKTILDLVCLHLARHDDSVGNIVDIFLLLRN